MAGLSRQDVREELAARRGFQRGPMMTDDEWNNVLNLAERSAQNQAVQQALVQPSVVNPAPIAVQNPPEDLFPGAAVSPLTTPVQPTPVQPTPTASGPFRTPTENDIANRRIIDQLAQAQVEAEKSVRKPISFHRDTPEEQSQIADEQQKKIMGAVYADDQNPPASSVSPVETPKVSFSGPTMIPGHEVRRASPEVERLKNESLSTEELASKQLTEANISAIVAQKQADLQRADIIQKLNDQTKQRESARQAILDQHIADQRKMSDDIQNTRIDPTRAFGTGASGVMSRIFSVLSMAMGGWVAGAKGGPNMAAEMIDKWIDRDIDLQVKDLQKKQGMLQESKNLYAQKLQQFGDQRAAEAATKSDMLNATEAIAQSQLADSKSDVERAKGTATIAAIRDKQADTRNAILGWQGPSMSSGDPRLKKIEDLTVEFMKPQGRFAGYDPKTAYAMAVATVLHKPELMVGAPAREYMGGGAAGGAMMQSLIARLGNLDELKSSLEREKTLAQKGVHLSVEDRNESEARLNYLPGALASAIDGSSSDVKVQKYEEALPDPVGYTGSWTTEGRVARLSELIRTVDGTKKNLLAEKAAMQSGASTEEAPDKEDVSSLEAEKSE
jgi:hypothetical protein